MPDPNIQATWGKAYEAADRLFDRLSDLEDVGGIDAVAAAANWTPKAKKKAIASLTATRDALNAILKAERHKTPKPPQEPPR